MAHPLCWARREERRRMATAGTADRAQPEGEGEGDGFSLDTGRGGGESAASKTADDDAPVRSVESMSVRELREMLGARGVDFSHCIEKCELRALAQAAVASDACGGDDAAMDDSVEDVDGEGGEGEGASCMQWHPFWSPSSHVGPWL